MLSVREISTSVFGTLLYHRGTLGDGEEVTLKGLGARQKVPEARGRPGSNTAGRSGRREQPEKWDPGDYGKRSASVGVHQSGAERIQKQSLVCLSVRSCHKVPEGNHRKHHPVPDWSQSSSIKVKEQNLITFAATLQTQARTLGIEQSGRGTDDCFEYHASPPLFLPQAPI